MESVLDRSLGPGFDALETLLDKTEDKEQTERDVRVMVMTRQLLIAIDAERERRGLTKSALAELTGINPQQVRRLFTSEKANPTLKTLLSVLAALRISWSFDMPAAADETGSSAKSDGDQVATQHGAGAPAHKPRNTNGRKRRAA